MRVGVNGVLNDDDEDEIRIVVKVVRGVEDYKYLGSTLQGEGAATEKSRREYNLD